MALNDIKVYNYGVVRSFLDVPPAKGNTYCIRIERTTTEKEQVMGLWSFASDMEERDLLMILLNLCCGYSDLDLLLY